MTAMLATVHEVVGPQCRQRVGVAARVRLVQTFSRARISARLRPRPRRRSVPVGVGHDGHAGVGVVRTAVQEGLARLQEGLGAAKTSPGWRATTRVDGLIT
jgi:hypothetical protein